MNSFFKKLIELHQRSTFNQFFFFLEHRLGLEYFYKEEKPETKCLHRTLSVNSGCKILRESCLVEIMCPRIICYENKVVNEKK